MLNFQCYIFDASLPQLSQFFNDSTRTQLQDSNHGSGTNTPSTTDIAMRAKDVENGNATDTSMASIDSLRLNLQDLNFNPPPLGQSSQVTTPGQSSHAVTPSYVMTPEERRRSIEQVLKASFKDRNPSLKDLAEWKMLYEHGRRSPRPLPSVGKNNISIVLSTLRNYT